MSRLTKTQLAQIKFAYSVASLFPQSKMMKLIQMLLLEIDELNNEIDQLKVNK